jgi:hypothetical protein
MDGLGLDQPADCPEAIRPATVRLEVVARRGLIEVGCLTSLPIVLKPKPATVRLEVVARGWLMEVGCLTSLPIVLKP